MLPFTRVRLDLAYDGTDFHGWAAQPGLRTVQGVVEEALATVLRLPAVAVTCAGRTDRGVHARGQVVHLDVEEPALDAAADRTGTPPVEALVRRLNGVLPADVRVRGGGLAEKGFDARFAALWRQYCYRVADAPQVVDPLTRRHVLAWARPLDLAAMNEAAEQLLGEHEFAAFCRRREGATTIRRLLDLRWDRRSDGVAELAVRADAFCHHMVRSLTGCLLAVGEGRRDTGWPGRVLAAEARDPRVTVVPARGLTLERVGYPEGQGLAAQVAAARGVRTRG